MTSFVRFCFIIIQLIFIFCNISPSVHAMDADRKSDRDHEKNSFRVMNVGFQDADHLLWVLEPVGEGFCKIRSEGTWDKNLYLTMTSPDGEFAHEFGTDYQPFGKWVSPERQYWTILLHDNYSYKIRCKSEVDGMYFFLEYSKRKQSIVSKPTNDDSSQVWKIEPVYDGRPKEEDLHQEVFMKERMPGFKGAIYQKGDWYYKKYSAQYATSSYPEESTSPFMIAYPKDIGDIICALQFAGESGKKVIARSGGHHYSGKSSGGGETILLDMYYFNHLKRVSEHPAIIEVGPSVRLKEIAGQFYNWGVTIPHGECPFVNIGGHAQTGGYGHLLRSFGLALDHVQAFEIVLADGSFLKIQRPIKEPSTEEEIFHQALFRGVLSGNAGSFGIVTKYTLNCISDAEFSSSGGFSQTRVYNKQVFQRLMNEFKKWTELIERDKGCEALDGLDFMMTVESKPLESYFDFINMPLMNVELVDSSGQNTAREHFREIVRISTDKLDDYPYWNWLVSRAKGDFEGMRTLSALSHSFVRRWPFITTDGREFPYPYKKRVNGTLDALTDGFVSAFVQKIDDVALNEKGIHLVVQMGVGGGACHAKGNVKIGDLTVTSIPHRGFVYNFVFDLFYEEGYEDRAAQLQEEMQDIIRSQQFNRDSKERRYFWGTFQCADMSVQEIRAMYYDNEEEYARLQVLKGTVDPKDIFHTTLTVQLSNK